MKTLKICLVTLCLLPFLAGGSPQFNGANFFMDNEIKLLTHPKTGILVIEEWLPIQNYEGLYEVSNYGRIKTLRSFKDTNQIIIKGSLHTQGYPQIQLFKKGKMKCFKKHILVGRHFIHNPENKPELNHIDGDKTNIFFFNLEWATGKENVQHAIKSGLRHPFLKHGTKTERIPIEIIKDILSNPEIPSSEFVKKYGFTFTKVWRIRQKSL